MPKSRWVRRGEFYKNTASQRKERRTWAYSSSQQAGRDCLEADRKVDHSFKVKVLALQRDADMDRGAQELSWDTLSERLCVHGEQAPCPRRASEHFTNVLVTSGKDIQLLAHLWLCYLQTGFVSCWVSSQKT